MRVADFIAAALHETGVTEVFGVTGRGSLFLTDGIARHPDIEFVPMFHEQSAGFAANAQSQLSGNVACCMVSSGVASTNIVTPILNAWQDQLPVLFVSGQNHSHSSSALCRTTKRTFGEQEFDFEKLINSIAKKAITVMDVEHVGAAVEEVFSALVSGRPGPAILDVPLDVQSARMAPPSAHEALSEIKSILKKWRSQDLGAPSNSAKGGGDHFSNSSNDLDVVLLGSNFRELASDRLLLAIENSSVPVVLEAGANSKYHSSNLVGVAGLLSGNPKANSVLWSANACLAIGVNFRSNLVGLERSLFRPGSSVFSLDFDSDEFSELKTNFQITELPPGGEGQEWAVAKLMSGAPSHLTSNAEASPKLDYGGSSDSEIGIDLIELALSAFKVFPDNAIVVTDSGYCQLILSGMGVFAKGQRLLQPHSQGSMGAALAMAYGAAREFPGRPIVVVVGDGSALMNSHDLLTIAASTLPISIFLVDNSLYGIIRKRQEQLFRSRTVGTHPADGMTEVDLQALTSSSGLLTEDLRSFRNFGELENHVLDYESGPKCYLIRGKVMQPYFQVFWNTDDGTEDILESRLV